MTENEKDFLLTLADDVIRAFGDDIGSLLMRGVITDEEFAAMVRYGRERGLLRGYYTEQLATTVPPATTESEHP